MKYSPIWALVLLALWAVPGCCSTSAKDTTTKRSATIVIAEGNSFVFKKAGPNEPTKYYGGGSRITVELIGDTCYVNGQPWYPNPPVPRAVYTVGLLKGMYGKVPSVLEYVRSHSGDETEVWNRAYREWERQQTQLCTEVVRRYARDVRSHTLTPEVAADTAVATLRASPLVAAAYEEEGSRQANLLSRDIRLQWAGESDTGVLTLDTEPIPDLSAPKRMSLEEFEDWVHLLHGLVRKGPLTIELKGGNIFLMSGPGARERIEEQRRGK